MMKTKLTIINSIEDAIEKDTRAIALGFFDGIHVGHRHIIEKVIEVSKLKGVTSTVLSFVDFPTKDSKTIISLEERVDVLTSLGVEEFIVIRFTDDVRNMLPEDFYHKFLIDKFGAVALFTGEDYTFGRGGKGKIEHLSALSEADDVELYVVPDIKKYDRRISSTWIRNALDEGDMKLVTELLGGVKYSVKGEVLVGKKLGRTLGFPTINQRFPSDKYVCRLGVYRSIAIIDGKEYPSISNVGMRPTVENTNSVNCETYIYNWCEDLYGRYAEVVLVEFIRDEKKFSSSSELKAQVDYDKQLVAKMWNIEITD